MATQHARVARALLLVAALAACAVALAACATTTLPRDASGKPVRTIRAVHLAGNRHIPDDELLAGLGSRPESGWPRKRALPYDPDELDLDVRRIVRTYERQGFASAKVVRANATLVGDTQVDLHIIVDEGEPTRVIAVTVEPAPGTDAATFDPAALGITVGEVIVYARYLEGKERLRARLVARGYLFAEVEGSISIDEPARRTASVRVIVDAGPRVRFGKTRVEGAVRVPVASVHARVAWSEGDVFDPELLALTETRLYGLGRFSSVRFDHGQEARPAVLDMTIRVTEATRHEVRLGGGLGFDAAHYEVRGRAGYAHRGWLTPMTTLRLDLRPSYAFLLDVGDPLGFGIQAIAGVEHEDFLVPRLRLGTELDYSVQVLEAYSLQGPRVRVALQRPFLLDRLTVSTGWQLRYQRFFDVDDAVSSAQAAELEIASPYRLGAFDQSVAWDRRDDPLEARRGYYLELRLEEGGAFAAGAFGYAKLTPEARAYLPLGRRLVLAARGRFGIARVDDDAAAVPITQRYFAGGASSQRGFSQQHLSPVATAADGHTVPIGGEALLETSLEARVELFELWGNWLGLVAFLDGADVTLAPSELDPARLHWAAGAGLRYHTVAGPIRLDVGYRLNRSGAGEPDAGRAFAFHLSVGEAF